MTPPPFTTLSGPVAPMAEDNIDTDIIFPARFLLITARAGLGRYAFHDRRYDADGAEVADHVLNRAPFREAPILIAGTNFGSGSSREQAVWALVGLGIRCVIAPSFGEIFHGNCQRNGVLPITLPPAVVEMLMAQAAQGVTASVDLPTQTLTFEGGAPIAFDIAPDRKEALIHGWDETAQILNRFAGPIAQFEAAQRATQPWLYPEEHAA